MISLDHSMVIFDFKMKPIMTWLSKMLESMGNAFIHPIKNDLPPSIGAHAYSCVPVKRKFKKRFN